MISNSHFFCRVLYVESWTTIQNLVVRNTTQIPNLKKIGGKLSLWQCSRFFIKDGSLYVKLKSSIEIGQVVLAY